MKASRLLLLLCGLFLPILTSFAQIVPIVSKVNIGGAVDSKPLPVSIDLAQNVGVTRVVFVYRPFGQSEYKELEMDLKGRSASVIVPANDVKAPAVEYYVRVELVGNRIETYPIQGPEANPFRISIKEPDPKDLEVRIMSPAPEESVAIEDLSIAISFFYASPIIDTKATRLFLDGVDVSKEAILTEDLMIYSPQNFGRGLAKGNHSIKVELVDTTGKLYHTLQSSFAVTTAEELQAEAAKFQGAVDGQLELRDEALSTSHRSYIRGDVRTNGTYSIFAFGGLMHLDNQDKPSVQPQNRFSIFAQTDFLRLEYGDAYPRYPSLLASGKRVRGFTGNLALGFFNLDVSIGQTSRLVEGIVDSTVAVDTSKTAIDRNRMKLVRDTTYDYYTSGTFKRDFFAVRPSLGSSDGFQFGLNFMKAKDDVASIKYGSLPQENVVTGADLALALDDDRFRLESQAMLSLTNTDISRGKYNKDDFDNLRTANPANKSQIDDLEKLANIANKIITVNENLFPTNPVGKGLPSVAFESALTLNYFNNYVYGTFFRRGASYKSFGNDFLQTDIQGFLVSDRVRMVNNRVFLSLSFERKNDNTADTKDGTTSFNNFNSSVTVNPANLPAFTIGYGFNDRVSDYSVFDPDSSQKTKYADETTNRFFFGGNYDFIGLGNRQNVSLSISLASKADRTFNKADQGNLYFQTSLTSDFNIPLQTTIGFAVSTNENKLQLFKSNGKDSVLSVTDFNYTSVNVGASYRMMNDNLRLTASLSPIFGVVNRVSFLTGALYTIDPHQALDFFFNYIQNAAQKDDILTSLVYRFTL